MYLEYSMYESKMEKVRKVDQGQAVESLISQARETELLSARSWKQSLENAELEKYRDRKGASEKLFYSFLIL